MVPLRIPGLLSPVTSEHSSCLLVGGGDQQHMEGTILATPVLALVLYPAV